MVPAPLNDITVLVTACARPGYLRETMRTWAAARKLEYLRRFVIAMGVSPLLPAMADVVNESGINAHLHMDSPAARLSVGMHRALGEAIDFAFEDAGTDFVFCGEEDVCVSDDVLEYLSWARGLMREDRRLLIACAHNRGGTGWDNLAAGPQDVNASQIIVRKTGYYNPWGWGISREYWENVVRPRWDWDCTSGGQGHDSGYDWNIATRIMPHGDWLALVPDAARSQNIGEQGGVYSTPDIYPLQVALSFREHREPAAYHLVED